MSRRDARCVICRQEHDPTDPCPPPVTRHEYHARRVRRELRPAKVIDRTEIAARAVTDYELPEEG